MQPQYEWVLFLVGLATGSTWCPLYKVSTAIYVKKKNLEMYFALIQVYICMYIHIYTCSCVCTHMHAHVCIHVYVCVHMYVCRCIYVCAHVRVPMWKCPCPCPCISLCVPLLFSLLIFDPAWFLLMLYFIFIESQAFREFPVEAKGQTIAHFSFYLPPVRSG